LIKLTKVFKWF